MLAPRRTKKTCCCQPPAPGRHWPRLDCAARVVLAGVFLPGVSFLGVRLSGVFEEAFRFLLETDAASSQGPSPLSASSSSDTASLLFLADVPSRLPTSRFNAALVGVFCTPFPARDVSSNRMHSGGTPRGDSAPPSLTTRHGRLPARTLILCATLSATCTISPRSTSSPFAARMCVATPCSVAAPAASDTDSAAFSSASVLLAVQQCRHAGVTRASVHSRRARSTRHCRASPAVSASSATRWHSGQVPRAAPSTACTRERANRQPRLSAGPCGAHALPEGQGTCATGQQGVRMCGGHLVQAGALGLVGTQLLDLVAAHGKAAGMRRRLNTRAQVIQLRLQPPSSRVRRLALAPLHHLPPLALRFTLAPNSFPFPVGQIPGPMRRSQPAAPSGSNTKQPKTVPRAEPPENSARLLSENSARSALLHVLLWFGGKQDSFCFCVSFCPFFLCGWTSRDPVCFVSISILVPEWGPNQKRVWARRAAANGMRRVHGSRSSGQGGRTTVFILRVLRSRGASARRAAGALAGAPFAPLRCGRDGAPQRGAVGDGVG